MRLQSTGIELIDMLHIQVHEPALQVPARGTNHVAQAQFGIGNVAAIDEAERRIEIGIVFPVIELRPETFVGRQAHAEAESRLIGIDAFGIALLIPDVGLERAAARQPCVPVREIQTRQRVVEILTGIALSHDDTEIRLVENAGPRANDGQRPGIDVAERVLANGQRTEFETADAPTDLAAHFEVDGCSAWTQANTAGEKRQAVLGQRKEPRDLRLALAADPAELKDIGLAQEEIALFGKEKPEAVEVHLAVIDVRGREIGVGRQGGVELWRELVENVHGRFEARFRTVLRKGIVRKGAYLAEADRRHDVEPESLFEPLEADAEPGD